MKKNLFYAFTTLTLILLSVASCKKERSTIPISEQIMFYKTTSSIGNIAVQCNWKGNTWVDTLKYYFPSGRTCGTSFIDNNGLISFEGIEFLDSIITPQTFSYSARALSSSKTWSGSYTLSNDNADRACTSVLLN